MNWEDLRYFLAVCRAGSMRGAAKELKVNHSTVSRHIDSFEEAIGKRLFKRNASGYQCTREGQEIFEYAEGLENKLFSIERYISAKDETMSGIIRVTAVGFVAEELLMPMFARFCELYEDIELEINGSNKPLSLSNRQSDIAFRLCNSPPEHLIGQKLCAVHETAYVSKRFAKQVIDKNWRQSFNWVGWNDKKLTPRNRVTDVYSEFSSKHKIEDIYLQIQACRQGLGAIVLPCFIGDRNPGLIRVPPYASFELLDLWILHHPDMRGNPKLQAFSKFMKGEIKQVKDLVSGEHFTTK